MDPPPSPKDEWRAMMAQLSAKSCSEYRSIVFEHKDFVPYFQVWRTWCEHSVWTPLHHV